jgi:Ca2+-binding RTX toxin-like protein
MSFLRRGKGRRVTAPRVFVTVFALVGLQALAVVGAGSALASGTCTYNPATDTINVTIDAGTTSTLSVATTGEILFDGAPCGSATNSNTVAIVVLGQPSANETLQIDNETGAEFNTAISWAVDLGTGTGDVLVINAASETNDVVVVTEGSFTINGGGGEVLGVELHVVFGNGGDDSLDASGLTAATSILVGGVGDDVLSPSVAVAGDTVAGQGGTDTVSYAGASAAQCIVIDNVASAAGLDGNCDADLGDAVDAADALADDLEVLQSGAGNDTLVGAAGTAETFIPGDGNDNITGQPGDVIDWSSSSAAMVIDVPNTSATGQGTDEWTGANAFIGSSFDDRLLVGAGGTPSAAAAAFSGGDGVDTVDATAAAGGVVINLETVDDPFNGATGPDDVENAIGSDFNDALIGNDLRNELTGLLGDDILTGAAGNDTLVGNLGNDTFTGGAGADTVSFKQSPAGVNVDLSLGFATGEGDDSFGDIVEIIVGSPFRDTITGGPFGGGGTVNFLFKGKKGNDTLTGFDGNDTLKGGAGKDTLRGGRGDDTLSGARGNDRLFGGGGTDVGRGGKGKDICKGVEIRSSCGTSRNPKAREGLAAKLI